MGLLKGPILNCPKEGLMTIIDNRFAEQQSRVIVSKIHNFLSVTDMKKISISSFVNEDTEGDANKNRV